MAWQSPRTWVAGAVLLASQLNTDVRDNENVLKTPIDSAGNLSPTAASTGNISSSSFDVTQNFHSIDGEGSAADTLVTATLGTNLREGHILVLTNVGTNKITIEHNSGTNAFFMLDEQDLVLAPNMQAIFKRHGSQWYILQARGTVFVSTVTALTSQASSAFGGPAYAAGFATLNLSTAGGVATGARAALISVRGSTHSAATFWEVRKGGGTTADVIGGYDADALYPLGGKYMICELGSTGDMEYRYGHTNTSTQQPGIIVRVHGYVL